MKPNLEQYLKGNFEKGIIDHAIRVSHIDQSGKPHFYMHPHGYDGDTLDFVVNDNWITQKYANEEVKQDEKKSKLSVSVSIKDTDIFKTLLNYTESLIEVLSEYPLSEQYEKILNEVSKDFFKIKRNDYRG